MNLIRTINDDLMTVFAKWRQDGFRDTWKYLHTRNVPATVQFAKYGFCGVASVLVHNIVFLWLALDLFPAFEHSGLAPDIREKNSLIANLIAFPFGNIFAYWVNSIWVFTPGRHSKVREFLLFTFISFVSFCAGLLGGPVLISEGVPTAFAQISLIIVSALVNFVCRKFFVFQK